MPDTSTLYTTVKNPTAGAITYGYLGPHGKRILAGATYTFLGDIDVQVKQGHGHRGRRWKALERDLLANRIEIVSTPSPIFANATPDAAIVNPTTQASNATSTGGSLAVGYYKTAYTFVNQWGETTKGTSLSAAIQVPDSTNDRVVVTVPDPAGVTNAVSVNVYMTAMAASSGAVDATTLRKVGSVASGSTTLNVDTLPAIDGTHPIPPTTNTSKAPTSFVLGITDGTLGTADPSWGRYTG